MSKQTFEIFGEKELTKFLKQCEPKLRKKLQRQGVSKALTPFVSEAKKRAAKDTGLLKKSIRKKIKTYGSTIVGLAGPAREVSGAKKGRRFRRPAHYAHLIEFGHRVVHGGKLKRNQKGLVKKLKEMMRKKGTVTGAVAAKPFMRPALAATQGVMMNTMKNTITAAIVAESK